MPDEQATVDAQDTKVRDDPMRDIIEMEARQHLASLRGTDLEKDEQKDTSSEGTDKDKQTKPDASDKTSAREQKRNLGVDEVLKSLDSSEDEIAKEAARIVRSMQTQVGNTRSEYKRYQQEFKNLADEVQRIKDTQSGETPDPEDPLNQVKPEQVELFERLATKLGYIKQDTLEQSKIEESTLQFKQTSAKAGMEKWGENFGELDDEGQFHFNEEVMPKVAAVYERYYDPARGVTPEDLFILATYEDRLKESEAAGKAAALKEIEDAKGKSSARTSMVKKGMTETGSVSSTSTKDVIYKSGDTLEDVIARASRNAMRELAAS